MVGALDPYIPDRGDLVWLHFGLTEGREQHGRRPALILSPAAYNAPSGLAIVCPITSTVRGFPFEVALPDDAPITGVILADQLKSVAYRERHAEPIGSAPVAVLSEVQAKLETLIL
jgi:mRNA interferase MazF